MVKKIFGESYYLEFRKYYRNNVEAEFLPKVIEYDRYQPEFYEDAFIYIKKEPQKVKEGLKYIKKKKSY